MVFYVISTETDGVRRFTVQTPGHEPDLRGPDPQEPLQGRGVPGQNGDHGSRTPGNEEGPEGC